MGEYRTGPDLIEWLHTLQQRVAALETTKLPPRYTTATRPAPSTVKGLIIFNDTTGKHEGSDGAAWFALY